MIEIRKDMPAEDVFRYMEKLEFPSQYRELLGMGDAHLHWHLFPRRAGDIGGYGNGGKGPVWWYPMEKMYGDEDRPSDEALADMKQKLRTELDRVFGPNTAGANRL